MPGQETKPFRDRIRDCSAEQLGAFAERLWANLFAACPSIAYVPLHKICDRGAPLQRGNETLILPDFEVSSNVFNAYVDSKGKRSPVFYRHASEWRHGIERHNYTDYLTISERGRKHCFLAVFECFTDRDYSEWSGALLLQSLARLGEPAKGMGTMPTTVFWPRDCFAQVGILTAEEALAVWRGKWSDPWIAEALSELLSEYAQEVIQGRLW